MKRIILSVSVLLMLVQNGFAKTDAEYDKQIANEPDKVWKQIYRCNKATMNHSSTANVNICLKAIELINKNRYVLNEGAKESISYLNAGAMYVAQGDKLKAYEYYMKAAKLGNTIAQSNLSIMCKQNPWACK